MKLLILLLPLLSLAQSQEEGCPTLPAKELKAYSEQSLYPTCMARNAIEDLGLRHKACECVSQTLKKKLTKEEVRLVSAYYDGKLSAQCLADKNEILWEYVVDVGTSCVE